MNELQAIEEKCRLYVAATKLDLVDGHRSRQVLSSAAIIAKLVKTRGM